MFRRALACATALVGLLTTSSQATPITEQTLIATGGDVVITFDPNDAGYMSELILDGAYGDTGNPNHDVDGLPHEVVQSLNDQLLVGFEDMLGGGDFDYDDLAFTFSDVTADEFSDVTADGATGAAAAAVVDEPATLVMLGSGLSMLVIAMRRRQSAAGSRDLKPEA